MSDSEGTRVFPVEHVPGQRGIGVGHKGGGRKPLGSFPWFPMGVQEDPRKMVELRASLLDFAEPGSAWEESEIQRSVMGLAGPQGYDKGGLNEAVLGAIEAGKNQVYWYRKRLPEAQLIHVSVEMTDVIEGIADSIPDDWCLKREDMPCPTGLIVFARPVWGRGYLEAIEWQSTEDQDAIEQVDIRVDALMWSTVHLPPSENRSMWWSEDDIVGNGRESIGIAAFRYMHPDHDDDTAKRFYDHPAMEKVPMWMPLGRTDWPLGEPLNVPTHDNIGGRLWDTMMDDRRLALSLWTVVQQKKLIERREVHADRPARKRLERSGRPVSPVQVIHLRRPEYRPQSDPAATGRHVSVRFPVRPFTRQQAYGPNRSLRKLIVVPPHWRGPVDGPVVHAERIWSVDR